jgi:threonylcarbamoyladenosine tRNA methylthiotransferase MtaB
VPRDDVIRLFDEALKQGAPEIVLSGIHIGRYGSDLVPATSLTTLVRDLDRRRGEARIRLSSIEPTEITPELIAMLGKGICRHLHIPLQSGDDVILKQMNRQYHAGAYRALVGSIAERVPGTAIGADVMVGFPGEGEGEFQNTCDLIETLPITHLHVFRYSPRPGTPASHLPNQVMENIKKTRNESLRKLGMKKNFIFRRGFLGAVLPAVVERTQDGAKDLFVGLTDNYIRISVHGAKRTDIGRILPIRITSVEEERTAGEVA